MDPNPNHLMCHLGFYSIPFLNKTKLPWICVKNANSEHFLGLHVCFYLNLEGNAVSLFSPFMIFVVSGPAHQPSARVHTVHFRARYLTHRTVTTPPSQ